MSQKLRYLAAAGGAAALVGAALCARVHAAGGELAGGGAPAGLQLLRGACAGGARFPGDSARRRAGHPRRAILGFMLHSGLGNSTLCRGVPIT